MNDFSYALQGIVHLYGCLGFEHGKLVAVAVRDLVPIPALALRDEAVTMLVGSTLVDRKLGH